MYIDWLLILSNYVFLKIILSINLKKGDKSSQPKKKCNNSLIWIAQTKQRIFVTYKLKIYLVITL